MFDSLVNKYCDILKITEGAGLKQLWGIMSPKAPNIRLWLR